jgi:hypothetical protein
LINLETSRVSRLVFTAMGQEFFNPYVNTEKKHIYVTTFIPYLDRRGNEKSSSTYKNENMSMFRIYRIVKGRNWNFLLRYQKQ